MKKSKILIASQTHLSRNPRVLKEAYALSQAGYQVTICTCIYSAELLKEDLLLLKESAIEYVFYANLVESNIQANFLRLKRRAYLAMQSLGVAHPASLGYGYRDLVDACKRHKSQLYIMHQEIALAAGIKLLDLGFNVAFDLEDLYSEDLLPDARRSRPIDLLRSYEKKALKDGAYVTTTSNSLRDHLKSQYGGKTPYVIRNVFDQSENLQITSHPSLRLYWFSQTIGPGRGLELLMQALNKIISPVSLTLRGNIDPGYKSVIEKLLKKPHSVSFLPLIPNAEILDDMQNYDVGLALEPNEPLNKMLTISNKVFHYLSGGLPVIASDTAGQREIYDQQDGDIITLFKNGSEESLSKAVSKFLSKNDLSDLKANAYALAKKKFNWKQESQKLVEIVTQHIH